MMCGGNLHGGQEVKLKWDGKEEEEEKEGKADGGEKEEGGRGAGELMICRRGGGGDRVSVQAAAAVQELKVLAQAHLTGATHISTQQTSLGVHN